MNMPYTSNPFLPKLRAKAVDLVRSGSTIRSVARNIGVAPSTVSRWCQKMPECGAYIIETESSRPKSHPHQIPKYLTDRIVELRKQTKGRCAQVIHQMLINEGTFVSLSTVKRTLDRHGLIKKRSPWKRYHISEKRPFVGQPGDLVQIDTIHIMRNKTKRLYIYTLLDVCTRWAFAKAVYKINTKQSLGFVRAAMNISPFEFNFLQTDNGPEFKTHFSERIGISHRHSRVRMPNDNAHLERFNRTIQEEFLCYLPKNVCEINRKMPEYLNYYNNERLHLGIDLKTPNQVLRSY